MPQANNIVLADAQATPVNHTFVPIGRDPKNPNLFWFEDQSAANSVGFWRISVETKRPAQPAAAGVSAKDRVYRTIVGLHTPVLESLSPNDNGFTPAPTVAYVPRAFMEFIDPERSIPLDRSNVAKMAPLLLQNSQIQDILKLHTELT